MAEVSAVWRVVQDWMDKQQFPPNQSQLAQALGVQRSAVSDWKTGKTHPNPTNLRRLSAILEPTLGPDTYSLLMIALLTDMGFIEFASIRDRIPLARFEPTDDKNAYSILKGLPTEAELREMYPDDDWDDDVSEVGDNLADLAAADEQETPVSGEQEESDTP